MSSSACGGPVHGRMLKALDDGETNPADLTSLADPTIQLLDVSVTLRYEPPSATLTQL